MKKSSIKKQQKEAAATLGRKGGTSLVKKYGKTHMIEIGKHGAEIRWSKKSNKLI